MIWFHQTLYRRRFSFAGQYIRALSSNSGFVPPVGGGEILGRYRYRLRG